MAGYVLESFRVTVYAVFCGVIVASAICVPDWGLFKGACNCARDATAGGDIATAGGDGRAVVLRVCVNARDCVRVGACVVSASAHWEGAAGFRAGGLRACTCSRNELCVRSVYEPRVRVHAVEAARRRRSRRV